MTGEFEGQHAGLPTLNDRELANVTSEPRNGLVIVSPPRMRALALDQGYLAARPSRVISENTNPHAIAAAIRQYAGAMAPMCTVSIIVPLDTCLTIERWLPYMSGSRSHEILLNELESVTPLRRQQLLAGTQRLAVKPNGHCYRLIVAKRAALAALLSALKGAGLGVRSILAVDGEGKLLPVNLLPEGDRHRSFTDKVPKLNALLAVCLFSLLAFSGVWSLHDKRAYAERLQKQEDRLRRSAIEMVKNDGKRRADLELVRKFRELKLNSHSALEWWDRVSRKLPKNAWLTDLVFEQDKIFLKGFAESSATVLSALSQDPTVTDVAFSSPVVMDQQKSLERFSLLLKLKPLTSPEHSSAKRGPGRS